MKNMILFGAGNTARNAISVIGENKIAYIVDNDIEKIGKKIDNLVVYSYESKKEEIKNYDVVISVSERYVGEIASQLSNDGILSYQCLGEVLSSITREKIAERFDFIEVYNKAISWIKENSIQGESIICTSELKKGYPEVTGYYIPTLIRWGYRDIALSYTRWLLEIQKSDGSWYDTNDSAPYIFDTAQVLKGLLAGRNIIEDKDEIDKAIIKGCDWILSCMNEEGRLVTPDTNCWGNDEETCSELVHLYCISPIIEAGVIYEKREYTKSAEKIIKFYMKYYYDKIMNFSLLSHFYAYVMEALLDLGYKDMCKEAMDKIAIKQNDSGGVPAYNNVDWVCSTGLFQLALVWFRLGDVDKGNKTFEYACKLQNESGGWFGSYISEKNPNEINTYFPNVEISWANKYFLDALYYKNKAEFDKLAPQFLMSISQEDGRYLTVKKVLKESGQKILDVGCGKGRYLRNLLKDFPNNIYHGVDISSEVIKYMSDLDVICKEGTLTNIPYGDKEFDITYTCEALEHAIDIKSAIREMTRVTKQGGFIVVVDKNDSCYGELEIGKWEQWLNEDSLKRILDEYCSEVEIYHGLEYENMKNRDLFTAWIGKVK